MSDHESSEWVEFDVGPLPPRPSALAAQAQRQRIKGPLVMVESAFFASTSALIGLISVYFPAAPVLSMLRTFFPIPIALAYLRWGRRAAWMTTVVTALLLAVLMGPPRSLQLFIPYGLLGVVLGGLWRAQAGWGVSMGWSVLVTTAGLFFQIGLLSLLLGTNVWLYVNRQITSLLEWIFVKLGLLIEPSFWVVQIFAVGMVCLNAILYLLLVHLVSWTLLERVGNPIPAPPRWLQVLLDYDE
ncbi:DUF2232 domain-containing protein [Synechococcales cyanobacterium C]|uniref:DUF2232 domain-containing protein n=1 Tax=Petrachloros mirabilis ULC683 TaxID=2781853 RepID=A0A8K2A824_9CYAN|nr:DUF2232 domain-containing protein [Petrachloros mirabilis]NCJ07549.1 DUF2232 domain-containing protein [Petrachloros mirabilis ULC683]